MVSTARVEIHTRGQGDVHGLSVAVQDAVSAGNIRNGIVTVFVVGSTAAVTTIEFEGGAVADLNRVFEHLAPRDADYQHHLKWGDDNGSSHVRAAMLGPSVTVPILAGRVATGTWQQIVLVEFDTRPRRREVVVQILGD